MLFHVRELLVLVMSDEPVLVQPVSFAIHCGRTETHTLHLSALGSIVLSHHANPSTEITLRAIGGERKVPQCLRWWRALEGNVALRERIYTLAAQGINPLEQMMVTEHADGTVTFDERPQANNFSLESMMWSIRNLRRSQEEGRGPYD